MKLRPAPQGEELRGKTWGQRRRMKPETAVKTSAKPGEIYMVIPHFTAYFTLVPAVSMKPSLRGCWVQPGLGPNPPPTGCWRTGARGPCGSQPLTGLRRRGRGGQLLRAVCEGGKTRVCPQRGASSVARIPHRAAQQPASSWHPARWQRTVRLFRALPVSGPCWSSHWSISQLLSLISLGVHRCEGRIKCIYCSLASLLTFTLKLSLVRLTAMWGDTLSGPCGGGAQCLPLLAQTATEGTVSASLTLSIPGVPPDGWRMHVRDWSVTSVLRFSKKTHIRKEIKWMHGRSFFANKEFPAFRKEFLSEKDPSRVWPWSLFCSALIISISILLWVVSESDSVWPFIVYLSKDHRGDSRLFSGKIAAPPLSWRWIA